MTSCKVEIACFSGHLDKEIGSLPKTKKVLALLGAQFLKFLDLLQDVVKAGSCSLINIFDFPRKKFCTEQ